LFDSNIRFKSLFKTHLLDLQYFYSGVVEFRQSLPNIWLSSIVF